MPNIQVRVEEDLKRQAQEVASALGMEVATAIRIFLCQTVRDRVSLFTPSLKPQHIGTDRPDMGTVLADGAGNSFSREEWLRKAVPVGLTALENGDFTSESAVTDIFKRAGANVG